MSTDWRVERVAVEPAGDAPWRVVGAQAGLVQDCLDRWGFDDWAWSTVELMAFLRRTEYERTELLVALAPNAVVGGATGMSPRTEDEPDAVVGGFIMELPLADNTRLASGNLWARPGSQCREALLDAALELARAEGRTSFLLETDHLPFGPGAEIVEPKSGVGVLPADSMTQLAASRGFALEQVQRISTFRFPADDGALAALRDDAATHAGSEYAVHSWQGDTPEQWLDALAELIGRMSTDAPMAGIDWQAESWDADRVRARDAERPVKNRGSLTVVVEHVPTGELGAFTEAEWPLAVPEVAYQHDTLVAGPHRGRRLGMLVKATQLRELGRLRPQLRRLHTWNAAENRHMLAINEAIGFTVTGHSGEWQRTLHR